MAVGRWFATAYDEPAHVQDLPADVTSGRDACVCIVDQVVRGTGIVGRVTGEFGAVALRLRGTGEPLHVTVRIQLDELSTRWWSDRVRPPRTAPELPRLILLRAQGEVRGAAVLARPQGWRRAGSAVVTLGFDLTADELAGDGLLVVELAEPPRPSWVTDRVSARSALGLRIDTITVRTTTAPTADTGWPAAGGSGPAGAAAEGAGFPAASGSDHAGLPAASGSDHAGLPAASGCDHAGLPAASGCDLAVVPAGTHGDLALDLVPVAPAPPVPRSPSNRWTRQKPARAGFKVLRAARRAAVSGSGRVLPSRPPAAASVLGFDLLTGVPVEVETVRHRPGGLDVRLPATTTGPVLLGLATPNRGLSLRVRR